LDVQVLERLLAFRPFKRLYLCIGDHELAIDRPQDVKILSEIETLVWSVDGTTDFYDLKLVDRIRVDDDFGFDELRQIWK
jgi:hypothetical protein